MVKAKQDPLLQNLPQNKSQANLKERTISPRKLNLKSRRNPPRRTPPMNAKKKNHQRLSSLKKETKNKRKSQRKCRNQMALW